ncbi:MAG: hypothetical protein HYZ29_32630 [Myxococcales bacterium]|nr:hypothetical protein [Myxococcales bacterium]
MTSEWSAPLQLALKRTLEDLCFVAPDPDAGSTAELPLEAAAVVAFTGPLVGRLLVRVRGQALAAITMDMLGTEAIPAPGEQEDCLAEIANVACGTTLPMLGDPRAVFDVAPPVVRWRGEPEPTGQRVAEAKLSFESGAAELVLFIEAAGGAP